jgi:hypothetical protein
VQGPVFTKKTTSHIKRRKKGTKYLYEAAIRKMINKTDFEIQIFDNSATIGPMALKRQGDSVEFWADPNATYREFNLVSREGNLFLSLSSDDFYDEFSDVVEIHYEAKEKKLFFVFLSEDTAASDGDNDEHDERGTKIWSWCAS